MLSAEALGIAVWIWLSVVAVAVIGLALAWWLFRRNVERALAQAGDRLKWSEFAAAVRDDLAGDGWLLDTDHNAAEAGFESVLKRADEVALLTCRQGSGQRLAAELFDDLAAGRDQMGARRAILATNAALAETIRAHAALRGIEIIDGRRLWRVLRQRLPAGVRRTARQQPYRELTLHLLVLVVLTGMPLVVARWLPSATAPAAIGAAAEEAEVQPPTALPTDSAPPAAASPGTLTDGERQTLRVQLVAEIESLPEIRKASWATDSTLMLRLADAVSADSVFGEVCAKARAFPALGQVRLQVQQREADGSERSRWRLCQ